MKRNRSLNVYKIVPMERGEWLQTVNRDDYMLFVFDGRPRAATWEPVAMRRLKDFGDGLPVIPVDFPTGLGGSSMLMSDRARNLIEPYIEKYGEFLPLACDEGEFWAFHVTHFINALDETASTVAYASDDPSHVIMIHRYAFRPEKLTADWMFKIPQSRGRGHFFVTDPFVHMINGSGLTGLRFKKLWPQT